VSSAASDPSSLIPVGFVPAFASMKLPRSLSTIEVNSLVEEEDKMEKNKSKNAKNKFNNNSNKMKKEELKK